MERLNALAAQLGISRNVLLALLGGLVFLLAWYIRRHAPTVGPADTTGGQPGQTLYTVQVPLRDIINGPWSSGADNISANPSGNGTSPNGGGDSTTAPPTATTKNYATTLVLSKGMSLQDIANLYHLNLSWLKSWNQQFSSLTQFTKTWWPLPAGTHVNIPHAG